MVKIAEISRTSTFSWSHECLPLLATGTVAGAVDLSFSSQAVLEIWDVFSPIDQSEPVVSAPVGARFHAIGWSKPFDKYSRGVIAGGFENGLIEFWDANVLLKTKDLTKASIHKDDTIHTGFVKSLLFHPTQDHVMVSGGDKGQIFVWDLKTFAEPKSPGSAMTPMEIISSVAWNQAVPHIFALTAGNSGYTSIWDLKAKREVLHLSYQGTGGTRANFSCVAWHPTQLTKLVTASDNDGCPLILTWDLRNSNAPEKILTGHTQGVLSLDWCQQDPELLISSGKDNATMLWNPITGEKLGEYPTTANWAFQTKFAPLAPDIFATASFDGKIIVQSLQDTSPPVLTKVSQSNDDNQFWNEISTAETQQPKFEKKQAPKWLKNPVSVGFGFGSKLVSVSTDTNGKSVVEIKKFVSNNNFTAQTAKFSEAVKTGDFKLFIESKSDFRNSHDEKDWELLKKLSEGKKLIDDEIIEEPVTVEDEGKQEEKEELTNGGTEEDSFFDNLGKAGVRKSISSTAASPFVPSGEFSLFGSNASEESTKLTKLVLAGKIDEAVRVSIEQGLLVEALILALDGSKDSKQLVKNEYFKTNETNPISRLLYSVSSKNVTDVVANANVENWKEIAISISSYATDSDDYNAKITELGDRILAVGGNRSDALVCYLAGNATDKISTIWLGELESFEKELLTQKGKSPDGLSPSDARFEALNIFVEKLATYRSLSNAKGLLSGPGIEKACKVLLEYSNLVAGYGEFELAEKFLEILPEDFAGLKLEKDRIGRATGKTAAAAAGSTHSTSRHQGASGRVPGRGSYSKSSPIKPLGHSRGTSGNQPFVPTAPSANPGFGRPPITNAYSQTGPPTPLGPGAPLANPYAKPNISSAAATPNPYAPQGATHNPYKPSTPQFPNSTGPSVTNTFAPPPPTSLGTIAPPPTSSGAPPFKKDEGGWNDLPDTFQPKVAPRRATPSGLSSPTPVASPQPNIQVLKRTSSAAAAPVLPPPPKGLSRTPSKQSVPTNDSPSLSHSQLNTRYAPPPSAAPLVESPKLGGNGFVENHHQSSQSLPPKNPYAPTTTAAPPSRNAYAQPSPSAFQANPNPVAPPPAPPKNPYAPAQVPSNAVGTPTGILPPPKVGGLRSPPVGGPPPPMNNVIPPPPTGSSFAPTPSGSVPPPPPPSAFQSKSPAPPPAAPVKEKYPAGDRSHIPDGSLPIYTSLNSILEVIMPDLPAQYAKHGEAVVRRLNILFDHLNNDDLLSEEVIQELKNVCDALNEKDYKEALALHLKLTTNHSEETSNWHPGVKHLIQMAEALQ